MKIILTFLVVVLFSPLHAQTITFNGCHYLFENQDYTFNLTGSDGTGRNQYSTTPIDGGQHCGGIGTCEFKMVWSASNTRWEFVADGGNGGFSETLVMYYNTSPSTPNPPSLSLGNWIENTPVTNSLCGGTLSTGNATLSGSVQNTVLGVDDFSALSGIVLYPNPARDQLTILSSTAIKTITVWNLQGQQIASFEDNPSVIDVSSFQAGLYLIRLETDNGWKVANFIKK